MDSLPIHPYPYGWFQIDYSNAVRPGEVRPVRAFGREFVLWRDERKNVHLMDAYCRHLGAHLGYGGQVVGCEESSVSTSVVETAKSNGSIIHLQSTIWRPSCVGAEGRGKDGLRKRRHQDRPAQFVDEPAA